MSTLAEHIDLYDLAWQRFLKLVEGRQVTAGNIIVFVTLAMEVANQYDEMQGFEKKELVVQLIKDLVMNVKMDQEDRKILQKYFAITLERTIDILISASTGKLGLGDGVGAGGSGSGCLPCFSVRSKKIKGKKRKQLRRQALRSTTVNELMDIIYQQTKKAIGSKKIGPANIIILVTITMQFVEQYPHLQGYEKKEVCLGVVEKLILEIPMSDDDRLLVQLLLKTTLSRTIDAIVFAANGALDFSGFSACCPLFCKPPTNNDDPALTPPPTKPVVAGSCACSPDCKCGENCACVQGEECSPECHGMVVVEEV